MDVPQEVSFVELKAPSLGASIMNAEYAKKGSWIVFQKPSTYFSLFILLWDGFSVSIPTIN